MFNTALLQTLLTLFINIDFHPMTSSFSNTQLTSKVVIYDHESYRT